MQIAQLAGGVFKNAASAVAQAVATKAQSRIAGKAMEVEAKAANYINLLKERLNWFRMPAQYGVGITDALYRNI